MVCARDTFDFKVNINIVKKIEKNIVESFCVCKREAD